MQRNRTIAEVPISVVIPIEQSFKYQQIECDVRMSRSQGMSFREIGRMLGIDGKTIAKAFRRGT